MLHLSFAQVSFSYDRSPTLVIDDLSFDAHAGWTGVLGPNGGGKTTILALATGRLTPTSGSVVRPESALYCEQRTDNPPEGLPDLLSFPDADAGRIASMLEIEADWPYRWESLSHGERKRAQIAVALWQDPELLALDEPTNHLDAYSLSLIATGLERFAGIGLLVSHDRATLDRLCSRCLWLDRFAPPVLRPGGYSSGARELARERQEARREREAAASEIRRIEAEAARRREKAAAQHKRRSKRGLRWKDSDAREKIDRARISGADGTAGRLLRQLDGRREQVSRRLSDTSRPVNERVGVSVHGVRSKRDALLSRDAGELWLPDGRVLAHPHLEIRGTNRVAITGRNGAGKSTLVSALLREASLDDGLILFVPQELSAEDGGALIAQVREMPPPSRAGVISTVSRLGSDPEAVLATARPSPGEARKLKLALGLEDAPAIIVMDEPTNHLDVTSIECLEAALRSFEGALLLVSHDTRFIESTCSTRWHIAESGVLEVEPIGGFS